eukprot:TRINITY_DN6124_c0_g1_i1.p1 TRINITY_DN6124_c0_g1~~TRINITY_DN6124_c0_g1_i1.p1  ORF type:complete len:232 (+),score=52.17 TRINITY_DN6124_c0_g1_i1:438-1133(+)
MIIKDARLEVHYSTLLAACRWGNVEVVRVLLERIDPSEQESDALRCSTLNNKVPLVQLLIDDGRVDPLLNRCEVFTIALYNENEEMIRCFLDSKYQFESKFLNRCLGDAAAVGSVSIVQLLLKDSRVDPKAFNNSAIMRAASNGAAQVMRILAPLSPVDWSMDDNIMLRMAAQEGKTEVVRLLLEDDRVDPTSHNCYALEYAANSKVKQLILEHPKMEGVSEKIKSFNLYN